MIIWISDFEHPHLDPVDILQGARLPAVAADGLPHAGDIIGFEEDDLAGSARADAELNARRTIRNFRGRRYAEVFLRGLNAEAKDVAIEREAAIAIGDMEVLADRRHDLGPAGKREIINTHKSSSIASTNRAPGVFHT